MNSNYDLKKKPLKDNSNSEDWIVASKYKENSDLFEKIQRLVTDKNYNIDVICLLYRSIVS